VRGHDVFFSISRYTSETIAANVAELSTSVKMITSRVEQAVGVQLQREFHGFLEVGHLVLLSECSAATFIVQM